MAAIPSPTPLEPEPRVQRALRAAEDALAHANWDGAVLASGTVVREVARSHLVYNDQHGTLPQLLERLVKQQAGEPALSELAAALKPNGPLAGLFDLEEPIDGPLAEATLALVHDLITHIYGLRAKIHRLVELVEGASGPDGDEEPTARAESADAGEPVASAAADAAAPEPHPESDGEGGDRDAFGRFDTDPLEEPWRDR